MKHYLELATIPNAAVRSLLQNAHQLKAEWREGGNRARLRGQILGMIFGKAFATHARILRCGDVAARWSCLDAWPPRNWHQLARDDRRYCACHLTLCRWRDATHLFAFHHSGICRV